MLLVIDVGNSNIKIGAFKGEDLYFITRLATDDNRLEDQYAIEIYNILAIYHIDFAEIDSVIIGSVVPKITQYLAAGIKKFFGVDAMIVKYDPEMDLKISTHNPPETGADILAGCMAVKELYSCPCILIDMGTATKLLVMDKDQAFTGACIIPGVGISMDALFKNAALLSAVALRKPENVIGKSTVPCIQSGLVYGNAAMLDNLCDRIEEELGYPCRVIITGGFSKTILASCKRKMEHSDTLLLDGLKLIYEKAQK